MIKNKRIKKNWSEEDVQILIWVISKYADKKHFEDIEKDIVSDVLFRTLKIGKLLPPSSQGFQDSLACSSGSASKKSTSPPITGVKKNPVFWPSWSQTKISRERVRTPRTGR
jgi:hypothetical protein